MLKKTIGFCAIIGTFLSCSMYGKTQEKYKTVKEVKGSDGATATISLFDPDSSIFILELKGFKKDENLTMWSSSGMELISNELNVDESPKSFLAPSVIGMKGGLAKIDLVREKEVLSLEYPWGIQ